ncbi:MAG: NUDIX hydrolase [Xenococcaceae cyanobacterium MO_167.B27]|nr:NUDIX hydrolase [Xenococcaceae cyanobacterium MO_167.B27]
MTEIKKWQTLNSRFVVDNQWCRVRQDKVKLPNETIVDDYFVHVRPDIALVLPITPDKQIVFVQQYRHGAGEILLELPAGTFDPNTEDSLNAARRELREETGYVAQTLTPLAILYDNPVKNTNRIHLYAAHNVTLGGKQQLDDTEAIEVVLIPIAEVKSKIISGEICVCGSIAALFLGLDLLFTSDVG